MAAQSTDVSANRAIPRSKQYISQYIHMQTDSSRDVNADRADHASAIHQGKNMRSTYLRGRETAQLDGRTLLRLLILCIVSIVFSSSALAQGLKGDATQPDTTINVAIKTEVVHALEKNIKERYVFPDTGDKLAQMLRESEEHGDYDSVTSAEEFSRLLTRQMKAIAHDQHLQVFYLHRAPPSTGAQKEPGLSQSSIFDRDNFGFQEIKRLHGDIGYMKITHFAAADQGGPTVAAAMTFLSHTDALIIDLRQNGGGDPDMVDLLASYLFPAQPLLQLNDLIWRGKGTMRHTSQQFWTLPYVPGPRYLNRQVYVLVSHETLSAAEEFAYDLQALKRATVVGSTTWGGANPGAMVPLADDFLAFIPTGQAVNPITKTNWEGTGVQPDVKVPASNACDVAYRMALKHLIATTNDEEERSSLKSALAHAHSCGADVPQT